VIAIDVFEHFTREELFQLIRVLYEALRNEGLLLVQTANGQGIFPHQVVYGDLTHMTILTPDSLTQALRPAGFGSFAFYETGPTPKNIAGRVRGTAWGVIKLIANAIRLIETGKNNAFGQKT
jgi:hypothetical protein